MSHIFPSLEWQNLRGYRYQIQMYYESWNNGKKNGRKSEYRDESSSYLSPLALSTSLKQSCSNLIGSPLNLVNSPCKIWSAKLTRKQRFRIFWIFEWPFAMSTLFRVLNSQHHQDNSKPRHLHLLNPLSPRNKKVYEEEESENNSQVVLRFQATRSNPIVLEANRLMTF